MGGQGGWGAAWARAQAMLGPLQHGLYGSLLMSAQTWEGV